MGLSRQLIFILICITCFLVSFLQSFHIPLALLCQLLKIHLFQLLSMRPSLQVFLLKVDEISLFAKEAIIDKFDRLNHVLEITLQDLRQGFGALGISKEAIPLLRCFVAHFEV